MTEKYHFIGIGGIGMSGLARILLNNNIQVSGSDLSTSYVTEGLAQSGAKVFIGHSSDHISQEMTVVYSTDIKKDNPELQAAQHLKCPLIHRSELLHQLMKDSRPLAVAGTHGKTTTSALLAWVLESAGQAPSFAIGGIVPQLSSNAGKRKGTFFVAEACESDGSFLNYNPFGAIVTNIDFDHMDHYGTEEALLKAFDSFIGKVASHEHLFWCGDDRFLRCLSSQGISYGFGENCMLKAANFKQTQWSITFDIDFNGRRYPQVEVSLTGKHNALNALAVFGMALSLGINERSIRQSMKSFAGVLRRCEKKGQSHGILFLDDYAHHPTEIQATLKAVRNAIGERRLIVIYQPHRYSRAKGCMGLYQGVFLEADALFVTEIYAAREQPIPGITHENIISEIQQDINRCCQFVERKHAARIVASFLRPHDVVITLGAGDVTNISAEILAQFKAAPPAKIKAGLIFGGMSVEHEVSLISAQNILSSMRTDFYDIELFGITRNGSWIDGNHVIQHLKECKENSEKTLSFEAFSKLLHCDIIFPVMHGTYGEDGTLQGLLEVFSKAYVGCDHRSAAIAMDKVLTKRLVQDQGMAVLPYIHFNLYEWNLDREGILQRINDALRYPLFVKPIHLGSSVGVHKVAEKGCLINAIEQSFKFDSHLIVENGIENVREIEFSLLGNDEVTVFPPGEVYAKGALHDFDSKYGLNPSKPAAEFAAKADLTGDKIKEGMQMAERAYRTVGCKGMARVDTFLDPNGKFWFNEINPIPGFTKYSLYPIMCQANGLSLEELIDRLIVLGMHRRRMAERLEYRR